MKKVLLWIGKILITIVGLYYLFILVMGLIASSAEPITWEGVGVVTFSFLTVASVVLVYIKTRLGSWVVLGVGIAFSIFALFSAGGHLLGAVMVSGGPLVIGGILLVISFPKKTKEPPEKF